MSGAILEEHAVKPALFAIALFLALAVPTWPRLALADSPPSSFTIYFDGDAAIWNPFNGFQACESALGETLCLNLSNVSCNGAGTCSGNAQFHFSGLIDGNLNGVMSAKLNCTTKPDHDPDDRVCSAKLAVRDAAGTLEGCSAKIPSFKVSGPVDYLQFFDAKGSAKVCVEPCPGIPISGCFPARGAFEYDVNPPVPWSLTVAVEPDPSKPANLTGTANANVSGRIFTFTASGKHAEKSDLSKIVVKGIPGTTSEGAAIGLTELVCNASDCTDGEAKIKLQGNKSRVEVEP